MARQNIELGTAPTGVGGDTPRSANTKINSMTTEIYARLAQLGTAANANIGTASGNVMAVGAGGLLGPSLGFAYAPGVVPSGLYGAYNVSGMPYVASSMLSSTWGPDQSWQSQLVLGVGANKAYFRSLNTVTSGSSTAWVEIYHTGNTTRASDGTLKAI